MVVTIDGVKVDVRWCDGWSSHFDAAGPFSLGAVYDAMQKEGVLPVYFYAGVPQREDFVRLEQDKSRWCYAWFTPEGEPLVLVCVSDRSGKVGMFHFCYLKAGYAMRFAIARHCMDTVCGEGGLEAVLGLTPEPFRHAWRFAEDAGFRRLAVLPAACVMERKGTKMVRNGVLTMYQPQRGE